MANAKRKKKPNVLSNPTLTRHREQAGTGPLYFTCAKKEKVI